MYTPENNEIPRAFNIVFWNLRDKPILIQVLIFLEVKEFVNKKINNFRMN